MDILKEMSLPLVIILVAQFAVFAVVAIVLRKVLLSDTMNAVRRMKAAEAELARKEDAMRQKMEAHEQELVSHKAEAEEDLRRQKEATDQDLARMKERMKTEARLEADKILSEAQLGKEKIRDQLVSEMNTKAVDFAGQLFDLVVSEQVGEALNAVFVDELIAALQEVDEGSVHIEPDAETEFASSHPLDPKQRVKLESLLAEKFGVRVKIEEKVDGALLAGLVMKVGSLEIDGSMLNRYREAVNELKKRV